MNKKVEVSIIIPTRNRAELLGKAVCSFQRQTFPEELYEIIVVDNASSDSTKKLVEKMASDTRVPIHYILEERIGLHYARHTGARHARGEILLYGDDDIVASQDWVEQIYLCYLKEDAAAAGGRITGRWEAEIPEWFRDFGEQGSSILSLLDLGEGMFPLSNGQSLYGCNFSIRKSVLFRVGGFNPDGFPKDRLIYRGDGESGLIKKLKKRGYRLYYNSYATVEHVISINRLNRGYFKQRYYREGISRSYSVYRDSNGSILMVAGDILLSFLRLCQKGFMCFIFNNFRHKCFCIYLIARIKHNFRIITDSNLKKYTLRDTYYD